MASSKAPGQPPFSPEILPSLVGRRPRLGSTPSVSATSQVSKEQLAEALAKIHTSASQSGSLTTFEDFGPPPSSAPVVEDKSSAGDMVQQRLTGLYTRFKEVVGVAGKTSGHDGGQSQPDGQDGTLRKNSSASGHISGKPSISSLGKEESGTIASVLNAVDSFADMTPATSKSSILTGETTSQPSQPSKQLPQKSSGSSKLVKAVVPTASNPTVAPVTVGAFFDNEAPKGLTTLIDEPEVPGSGKKPSGTSSERRLVRDSSGNSSLHESSRVGTPAELDRILIPRTGRDDGITADSSNETSLSPTKNTGASMPILQPAADIRFVSGSRSAPGESLRRPAVIDRINHSRTPGSGHSRSSSMDPSTADSPISTSAHNSVHHESFTLEERPEQLRSGAMRIPGTTTNEGAPEKVNARLELMRKQVLSKEFWMADETCKGCFLCGVPFTAFRRKHHCRTCGCIFDSKCTSIISGQKFGVQGTLRVCKTCLDIINRRYDSDSDEESGDDSYLPAIFRSNPSIKAPGHSKKTSQGEHGEIYNALEDSIDDRPVTTPMMAVPATRRIINSSRQSAVLEISSSQLSRPSSSRSLKSMTGRPQSSGHKRHHSKHNLLGRHKGGPLEDRAPFRKTLSDEIGKKSKLPAFHDDNIIDPELAPYMSDESSGDEHMSIFTTMTSNDVTPSSFDPERSNFGPLLAAGRKNRLRQGEKSVSGLSFTSRGVDDAPGLGSAVSHSRPGRRRNLSTASASQHHLRSPRPKSSAFKGPSASNEAFSVLDNTSVIEATKLLRSEPMKNGKLPEAEMNSPNLKHVKRLFRQLLQDAEIPNPAAWGKALIPILIRCSDDVCPDTRNGDHMDIRHYVKLKKIPGARPIDTSYVSGVIFTKKLALKSMPRRILNPRIVIVSFPIEYQRQQQQHFMSLQPVIEQEKEFLRMVVNRIIALRPQVLLAEKSVSGVALQYLNEANIAVVYNVKPSVVEAVSRCAETEIISSLDMLALPIQVGQAGGFEVKTYVDNDYPGKKKTYIFISGCQENLGCTIALRGSTASVLKSMKRIAEFMVYVVYNLRLESCLMRELHVVLAAEPDVHSTSQHSTSSDFKTIDSPGEQSLNNFALVQSDQASQKEQKTSEDRSGFTDPSDNLLSELAVQRTAEQTRKLISLHESHSQASHDSQVPEDVPMPTFYSDMVAKYETKILSASPFVKFTQPYLLMKAREQERRLVYLKRLRDQDIIEERVEGTEESDSQKRQRFQLIKPEMIHETGQKAPRQVMEVIHAVHDAEYDKALHNYQMQTKQWESYIQGNLDLFDPYSHQNIVVLYSVVCTESKIPCVEAGVVSINFYDEHPDPMSSMDPDCTLGQWVEDLCFGAGSICHANGCDRGMYEHHRTYVHDEARLTVFLDQGTTIPGNLGQQYDDEIYTWSYCKVCKRDVGLSAMSDSAWNYSFGKFLELSYWGKGLHVDQSANCPHDNQRDHIRYFNCHDATVRIHYDPIDLLEITVPRARITWKVDNDLKLKNETFTKWEERWEKFMTSVKSRLKSVRIDSVLPEKADACKAEIDGLNKKAQEDQQNVIRCLQDAYMNSKYYEVIPLNPIIRQMLEKVTEWDAAFAKIEADFLSDKDVRQLTIIQLKKMFTDNESKESLPSGDVTSIGSEADDRSTAVSTQTTNPELEEKEAIEETQAEPASETTATEPFEAPKDDSTEQQTEAALERVTPLDLATSHSPNIPRNTMSSPGGCEDPSNSPSANDLKEATAPLIRSNTPPLSPQRPFSPPISGLSLTEKVEQLRREHRALLAETKPGSTEDKAISPRAVPERGSSRRAGTTISPPMGRALSQPIGTLPRLSTKTNQGKEIKVSESGDSQRNLADGSAKPEKKLSDRLGLSALKNKKTGQSSIPRYVHGKKKESKVSTLAKHFEQLSREFEKERLRDRKQRAAKMHHSRALLPRSSTKAIVEVYEDVDQAVQEPGPSDDDHLSREHSELKSSQTTTTADSAPTLDFLAKSLAKTSGPSSEFPSQTDTATDADVDENLQNESHVTSDDDGVSDADQSLLEDILPDVKEIADSLEPTDDMPLDLQKHQKTSLMKMLTNFWAERSASGWSQLEYPLKATDHIFIDSDVIVREDEPSSLIAFALSSEDYQAKLGDIRHQWKMTAQRKEEARDQTLAQSSAAESTGTVDDEEELEKSLLRITGTHLKYQFTDGSAKMLCKIFYAEQFDALRRKCGIADRIVESLSRCLKWDSKGGKTKSVFLKTLDDRLVMKSLSPIETAAFLKFAPGYFSIMAEALFHDLPSVIAKMLGFFQVIVKNPVTGTEIKLDLLVMENLFYDRSPTRIFDLKGSMRNRKIQSTGEQNEVLLDENMVEYIYESPLFAREHSKKLLRASVWNDTLFLARQNVMDYSLMIAVDESRKELVVGIIDCIRTYTWDKKLESWIKYRGFAGGGRNRPTVTSPKEYKSRFREAMARYILQAPNCWHQYQAAAPKTRFESDLREE